MRGSMELRRAPRGRGCGRSYGQSCRRHVSERLERAQVRGHESPLRRSAALHLAPVLLLALTLLLGATACSSGGTKTEATAHGPVELRYRALAKNLSFGIVNATHTDRTDLYSKRQPIDQATTKVSPDEVVDAIVDYFREQGFFDIAVAGKSPVTPPQGVSQILEVVLPNGAYHAVLRPGVSAEHATSFQTCAKALLDVYNNTLQLQAVEEAPLWGGGAARNRDGTTKAGG